MGTDKTVAPAPGGPPSPAVIRVEATVVAERPRLIFEVVLPAQQRVLAHLVGTVKRNFVRLVPGDRVEVELSPHDPGRGRITRKIG